jgi:hypothetical protein
MHALAKRAYEAIKTGGDGGSAGPKPGAAPDPGEAAGRAFAEAVKSSDGGRIKSAFKALYDECVAAGAGVEESEET